MHPIAMARRFLAAARKQRWRGLGLAWAVCLAGWVGVFTVPNQFASSTRIYADADAILGLLLRGIAIDSSPAGQVETLQRTLLSRPNLEKLISRTELESQVHDRASHEALLARLAREIRITTQTRNLFTIDFRDPNPRLAQDVVQTTLNLFMEAATITDRQQMENARSFVAQQIASHEVQLRQAERRRAEFQTRYIEILPSEALGGSSRLEAARMRLAQVRGELVDTRRRRELTQAQIDSTPALAGAAAAGGGGSGRLAEAERVLGELRLRFTDEHPDVVAARGVAASVRAGGGGGARGATTATAREPARQNPILEPLRLRLIDADAQIGSLERQEGEGEANVQRLDAIARSAPEVQAQSLNIDRDYAVLRRNFEELLARRESLQLAGAARSTSDRVRLEVVDPPSLGVEPVSPNRPLLAAIVLAMGIGAGAGLIVLLVQLDRGIYTVQDLRRIGPPVLGAISAGPRSGGVASTFLFTSGFALLILGYGVLMSGAPGLVRRALT